MTNGTKRTKCKWNAMLNWIRAKSAIPDALLCCTKKSSSRRFMSAVFLSCMRPGRLQLHFATILKVVYFLIAQVSSFCSFEYRLSSFFAATVKQFKILIKFPSKLQYKNTKATKMVHRNLKNEFNWSKETMKLKQRRILI